MIVKHNVCTCFLDSNSINELTSSELANVSGRGIGGAVLAISVTAGILIHYVGPRAALNLFAGCGIYSMCATASSFLTDDINSSYIKTPLKALVHTIFMAAAGCLLLAGANEVLRYVPNQLPEQQNLHND